MSQGKHPFTFLFVGTIIFSIFLGLSSCENEVDINADWKETIIVYGLLDANDSVQYIKINKAFLNEKQSAYQVAQISDSLYLDSVKVTLTDLYTGEVIVLNRTNKLKKDSGIFANDVNYLWQTTKKLAEDREYEINVRNPLSGTSVNSRTRTVKTANIRAPFTSPKSVFSLGTDYITVMCAPGLNAKAYDVKFLVKYETISTIDTSVKEVKTITWDMVKNFPVAGTGDLIRKIEKTAFFQFLGNTIPADPNKLHRILSVGTIFYGGNQNLVDYISVNEPSIGIVQKQSEYSNVVGGLGLFASRCKQVTQDIKFDPTSVFLLQTNAYTKALNFVK